MTPNSKIWFPYLGNKGLYLNIWKPARSTFDGKNHYKYAYFDLSVRIEREGRFQISIFISLTS